jgi:hypothetical protein
MKSPRENIVRASELQREAEQGGLDFMRTELSTALTFAQLAINADAASQKRARNQANARKAYDTLVHWRERFCTNETMREGIHDLEPEFEQLRNALLQLGEML